MVDNEHLKQKIKQLSKEQRKNTKLMSNFSGLKARSGWQILYNPITPLWLQLQLSCNEQENILLKQKQLLTKVPSGQ